MTLYNKNDPETIREMFNSIAKSYDKANGILSFQMHKRWNDTLVREAILAAHPDKLLDLCCGTGEIAFHYLRQAKHTPKVFLLDFSEEMLSYAREKADAEDLNHHDIVYFQADAQSIPLPENHIDCATLAYGIRNIKDPRQCIDDVYRVLKPGGTFGILELTQPSNSLLRLGHTVYLRTILPLMGKIVTSNKQAYDYLCRSIRTFIPPEKLEEMIKTAGFDEVKRISLLGGIATILIGRKRS